MMKLLGNKIVKKMSKKELKKLQDQLPELPEYHYVCMDCGKEYEKDNKDSNICIYCGYGNTYCEEVEE